MEYMETQGGNVSPFEGPGPVARLYGVTLARRSLLFTGLSIVLLGLGVWAVTVGSYHLTISAVVRSLFGLETGTARIVVWSIRLPRITAAVVAGCGLGLSGVVTQSLLKNPLASPFTLGINQGAACGAAFAIVALGAGGLEQGALAASAPQAWSLNGMCTVTLCAFSGAMSATVVILILARLRGMSPESVILAGIALSALFTSGTILIQYFASEVELAAVVFWTFGDVARSSWQELGILGGVTLVVLFYFLMNRWNLNALAAGEDEAQALGVNVTGLRLTGMILATLVAALVTAFHGVIAFLGLLAPHISRRLVGGDHRLLLPFSCLIGALLLLAADTAGRLLVGSGALPVGVLTSFMGAPLFLFLLIRGMNR
ncbi:FecCD family ABC transporter permease [Desulfoluna spongiiphila]|uniref:Iron complex transport system permease protein n=1 Tax=Desulfoluna spongiiphila TaxID=419481 RepID=A0A1G5FHS0_9BACT|nr:iron ABC transporter permease [Desulfoluna spongiiphila]SCY38806.1 iron complex transport system permease protein [Desulfoluna spongiiphila]VVS95593.1 abc transporter permease protein btuc-like [Desulfoluna spongiiphila]